MFLTGVDTSLAWSERLAEVNAARQYDVAIRLQRPAPIADAVGAAQRVA